MNLRPIPEAAAELRISARELRRWISAGCPVARRGARGRGKQTLVCVDSIRAWRNSAPAHHFPEVEMRTPVRFSNRKPASDTDESAAEARGETRLALKLAAELPHVLAEAAAMSHRLIESPQKRQMAGVLAGAWHVGAHMVIDCLRRHCRAVQALEVEPEKIAQLRSIFEGSCKVNFRPTDTTDFLED